MSHACYLGTLANDGFKPSQVARYINTKHLGHKDKRFKKKKKKDVMERAI